MANELDFLESFIHLCMIVPYIQPAIYKPQNAISWRKSFPLYASYHTLLEQLESPRNGCLEKALGVVFLADHSKRGQLPVGADRVLVRSGIVQVCPIKDRTRHWTKMENVIRLIEPS